MLAQFPVEKPLLLTLLPPTEGARSLEAKRLLRTKGHYSFGRHTTSRHTHYYHSCCFLWFLMLFSAHFAPKYALELERTLKLKNCIQPRPSRGPRMLDNIFRHVIISPPTFAMAVINQEMLLRRRRINNIFVQRGVQESLALTFTPADDANFFLGIIRQSCKPTSLLKQ